MSTRHSSSSRDLPGSERGRSGIRARRGFKGNVDRGGKTSRSVTDHGDFRSAAEREYGSPHGDRAAAGLALLPVRRVIGEIRPDRDLERAMEVLRAQPLDQLEAPELVHHSI